VQAENLKAAVVFSDNLNAPSADSIEVTVFGRGVGEAILIHYGDNEWACIDCLQTLAGNPAPMEYLEQIGVNVGTQLKYILATHWHDDHVRGITKLYAAAKEADLIFSQALRNDEFAVFLKAHAGQDIGSVTSGIKELHETLRLTREKDRRELLLVGAHVSIISIPASVLSHGQVVELRTLSPSPADVLEFMQTLSSWEGSKGFATTIKTPKRNDVAVASWLAVGDVKVLLGSDLEQVTDPARGWSQIVNSPRQPPGKAGLFKVPHHGSRGAYNRDSITKYLSDNVISVLTPFTRSGLPTNEDIRRVLSHSTEAYTAKKKNSSIYKPETTDEKIAIGKSPARISSLPEEVGYVRFRWKIGQSSSWDIATFNGASKLSKVRLK
jgi:beta-lactamase superfamily II metal-dependent hydrolase